MKLGAPLPDRWKKRVTSLAEEKGTLSVYALEEEPLWTEWALRFWKGEVSPKETVKDHEWGGYVVRARWGERDRLYYFKRFSIRHWRFLHKPRRARHTIVHEARMRDLGFHTPRTVALIERRRMGIVVDSALVTEAVTGAFRMFDLFNKEKVAALLDRERRRDLLRAFGAEVGRLHTAGLYHGDMHWGNLLVKTDRDRFDFFWTDNERGRAYKRLPFRWRVDDLNQVNKYRHRLSRADRMRMWRAYLEETGLSGQEADRVLRRVMQRSRAFWKKRNWL